QRGMRLLEDGIPIRAGELVDGVGRPLRLGRVRHRPCRQQRRCEVGDRPTDRLGELAARNRILLLLDRAYPEDEPRDAIVLVDLQNALGELDPFVSLAIDEYRQEGPAEQFVVTGITAQRGAVIGRRRRDVALTTRVPSGEIAARRRGPRKALARLRLRASGEHSRPNYGECSQCGHSRTPQEWRSDHSSSTPSCGRTPPARPRLAERTGYAPAPQNCPIRQVQPPF